MSLLLFYYLYQSQTFNKNEYISGENPNTFCGKWSPFDDPGPICKCEGTIVQTGGPKDPADDSGGYYECIGKIIKLPTPQPTQWLP